MNDSTSRRTWLQTLVAALFGCLALRGSPSLAAPTVNLPQANPADEMDLVTQSYHYDCDSYGKITEYTYDARGRLIQFTEEPGDETFFSYEV